jgi:two-component system, LytTR family, response regulator
MATAMYAYPPIASKCVGGIRVVVCDPDDEVRAAMRSLLEGDSLLTVVAESRDWATCELSIEELVPELLIARAALIPLQWSIRMAEDAFAPLLLRLQQSDAAAGIAVFPGELSIPIDRKTAQRTLDQAVAEIYDRKAKQLLYLVGRYVEASKSAPAYESSITVEHDGKSVPLTTDAIMAVIAARKSVTLHTASGRSTLREPIHQVAAKLDPACFVRIHRSVIVNLQHVDYKSVTDKSSFIVLKDGSRYPVGRNYRSVLSSVLQRAS